MENSQFELPNEEKMKALREVWKNLQDKGFYEQPLDNPMNFDLQSAEERMNVQPVATPTPLPVEPMTFEQSLKKKANPVDRLPEDQQKTWRDIFKR